MLDLEPDRHCLFLDFDGTLVDIAPRPDAVVVPDGLADLLTRLSRRLGGALAVVSGRPIAELDGFLSPARPDAAGLHGLEWRRGGTAERLAPPPGLSAVRAALEQAGLAETGVRVEDKGLSIALHYRQTPERGDELRALARDLAGPHPDLALLDGKMVVEIKPRAASKASAVRRFLREAPFVGRRPVFVGDDVTDEDGMHVALDEGGSAIKVGDGDSCAPHRLAAPEAVRAWLRAAAGEPA